MESIEVERHAVIGEVSADNTLPPMLCQLGKPNYGDEGRF
jgi:hypothetical protein